MSESIGSLDRAETLVTDIINLIGRLSGRAPVHVRPTRKQKSEGAEKLLAAADPSVGTW